MQTHFNMGQPVSQCVCARVLQFVSEQLTLSDVQDHMTRDDVIDLKLK